MQMEYAANAKCTSGEGDSCPFTNLPIFTHDGRPFCKAHLPLDAPVANRFTAAEFITFIVTQTTANASVDLTGISFPQHDDRYHLVGRIVARNCTFASGVRVLVGGSIDLSKSTWLGNGHIVCDGGTALIARGVTFLGDAKIDCGSANQLDLTGSTARGEFELGGLTLATRGLRMDDMTLSYAPIIDFNVGPGEGMPQDASFRRLALRRSAYLGDAEGRYRKIRNRLHQNRDREQEGVFYQYEKRALRKKWPLSRPSSWIPRSVSALYDWTVAYGQSYQRAIVYFLLLQFLFGLAYSHFSNRFDSSGSFDWQICAFTIAQLARPFEVLSIRGGPLGYPYAGVYPPGGAPWIMWTVVHSVLSLILVALILLALRWRFQRN
jgi:hypothetical protein